MLQRLCDSFHNRISLSKHCPVPEAEHLEAIGSQVAIAACVMRHLLCVVSTVNLDDQVFVQANEVDDVWAYRSLATELEAEKLAFSEA